MHEHDGLLPESVLIVGPEPGRTSARGGHIADVEVLLEELGAVDIAATVLTDAAGGSEVGRFAKIVRGFGRATRGAWTSWRLQPDLVILLAGAPSSFLEKSVLAGLCRLFGSRTLLCPRSGHIPRAIEQGPLPLRWTLRTVARLPHALAVQTQSWARFYVEEMRVPPARVHVVENWIVTPALQAVASGLTEGEKVGVLYATALRSDKGIDDVLAIVPMIAPMLREYDAVLSIVGDGPAIGRVRAAAETYAPHVEWHASMPRDEFLHFLAKQDVLIAPSHVEGFPNLLVEAACLNVAIVASPVGGISDVITHYETGVLVPPGAPEQLAIEVARLIEDPAARKAMARAARTEAVERFTASVNVRNLLSAGLGRQERSSRRSVDT